MSPRTVAKLLRELKYSLRTCRKRIACGFKPKPGYREKRNQQFLKIARDKNRFIENKLPVISVDAKKKEQIGNFKNNGRSWRKNHIDVLDHDFRSDATCMAVPYGIYDINKNRGMVVLGTSRETPAFAVDSLVRWWKEEGRKHYSGAGKLLILGDSGGGNSARSRVWKRNLQMKFCNEFGIAVTVCHYPPGASKYNPIERKYFNPISNNWAGIPLINLETVLNYIRTTHNKTGLRSRAILNQKIYLKGQKVSDAEMAALNIFPHKELPQWNYTIKPQYHT